MTENMVRTQVYLPRDIYEKLRARAGKHGLTLATQIRAALEAYLARVEAETDDGILHMDDPIFQMIGMFDSGASDLSINHDHYLYGAPKREPLPREALTVSVGEPQPPAYDAGDKRQSGEEKPDETVR